MHIPSVFDAPADARPCVSGIGNQKLENEIKMMSFLRIVPLTVLAIVLTFSPALCSQTADSSDPQFKVHKSEDEIKRDNERMKALNKDRAERIKRDTDKLYQLSTELKQYVDKTNENVMSLDVIRKADEVEKLAKSIKERMKQDYRIPDTTMP